MSEEKSCCTQGNSCEGKCFDDQHYIKNCIGLICCEGYCIDVECLDWARRWQACNFENICERLCCCYICCYWNLPILCTIISTFWIIIFFFLFFMPPMIIVLLQTRMLRPKKSQTFAWIEKEEIRADTTEDVSV